MPSSTMVGARCNAAGPVGRRKPSSASSPSRRSCGATWRAAAGVPLAAEAELGVGVLSITIWRYTCADRARISPDGKQGHASSPARVDAGLSRKLRNFFLVCGGRPCCLPFAIIRSISAASAARWLGPARGRGTAPFRRVPLSSDWAWPRPTAAPEQRGKSCSPRAIMSGNVRQGRGVLLGIGGVSVLSIML
jgi:hypothetical protein